MTSNNKKDQAQPLTIEPIDAWAIWGQAHHDPVLLRGGIPQRGTRYGAKNTVGGTSEVFIIGNERACRGCGQMMPVDTPTLRFYWDFGSKKATERYSYLHLDPCLPPPEVVHLGFTSPLFDLHGIAYLGDSDGVKAALKSIRETGQMGEFTILLADLMAVGGADPRQKRQEFVEFLAALREHWVGHGIEASPIPPEPERCSAIIVSGPTERVQCILPAGHGPEHMTAGGVRFT